MWRDFSDAAAAALRGSHTAVARVDIWHSGQPVYTLDVVSGSVTAETGRPVLRNIGCTLVDPTGQLTGGAVDDLLNPYDCEIAPWRGVLRVPNDPSTAEYAPLGVFGLTSREVTGDGSIEIAGQDRAMRYQGPMTSALAISGGTPIEVAIARLLSTRNPGLSLLTLNTGFTCGPLLYVPDIDVWREAQDLAASVGARLFHDRTGQPVLALAGPASNTPAAAYATGDGLLLEAVRKEDSDTIRNVVIAESTNGLIRVVVEDTDPTSPTFAGGRYGRRPVTIKNQHFSSVEQARQAAAIRLAYELGRSETVTFTAVPDPARDVDEVVTVNQPRAGLQHRGVVVASVEMPLEIGDGQGAPMVVRCRQSRLAPDGQVFPISELTA